MGPNRRAKLAFFHWFCSIFARIRSQGAESVSCSKKGINAVAISSDNPHNQPILCETCIDRRAHDAQVQSAETLCISILDVPRCWDREMGAQDTQDHIWIKLCTKFHQDLATDVPRTLRSTFGSNCVIFFTGFGHRRAQDVQEHIWVKLCTKFLQDLATDVPRTLRITSRLNYVPIFYRIWPQTCPRRSGAHSGQIVY